MKRSNAGMLRGPLLTNIISYTVPIILTSILQLLFNAADLVIVGRFRGSIALAAVGATGALTNLIVNLFIGMSVGTGVAIAHGMGGHEDEQVHRTVHTSIPLALVSGVVLTIIGITMSETFLKWMGTDEAVLPLSTVYMKVYFSGMTFTVLYNYCASILRAVGDTKSPLIYLTIAGVLNVILNVALVAGLGMHVEGVALATVISQGVSAVLVVIALMRRTDACKLTLSKMRFYKRQLLKIVRIGFSAGLQGSMFSISNVMIQSSINSFGDIVMSGSAAAGNIEGFVWTAMNGLHQTAVNFVGQNVGARQFKRAYQTFWICLGCVGIVGLVMGVGAYIFAPQLLSFYITDSQQAIAVGVIRMGFIALPYFICGLMEVTTGALRGLGVSALPMLISVMGICVFRLIWIWTVFQVPQLHTLECLFFSYPVSWVITFVAQLIAFFISFRKQKLRLEAA